MSGRVARRSPRASDGIAFASLGLLAAGVVMALIAHRAGRASNAITGTGFIFAFGGMGWLMARRLPHNPIGWSFSIGGLMWALGGTVGGWADLALTGHVPLTAFARLCLALNTFAWIFAMPFSIQLPLLLLPDGRLLSPRWRPGVWIVLAGLLLGTVGFSTQGGEIAGLPAGQHLVNPIGVRALGPVPTVLALVGAGLLVLAMLLGVTACVLRFRRSHGMERQQMRWVAFGGCALLTAPLSGLFPLFPPTVSTVVGTLGIMAVPVCVGIAVLRYRLYDLGSIVSRTVSYAVLTALLIPVYFGLVTSLARLLPGSSSLAVGASTLAVAALFQPLRRRVQTIVDHRFNRARYDAERTLADFSHRLRNEVDLDAVQADLLAVVAQTMQPADAGIWLRAASR